MPPCVESGNKKTPKAAREGVADHFDDGGIRGVSFRFCRGKTEVRRTKIAAWPRHKNCGL